MAHEIGELLIGKVYSVKPYALFLEFEDDSKGLLHISEIGDGYIKDIEKYGTYDDELKVKIVAVDPKNGFLRLSLKQVPIEERYSTHTNSHVSEIRDLDFSPLKERMSDWIKQALDEIKEK